MKWLTVPTTWRDLLRTVERELRVGFPKGGVSEVTGRGWNCAVTPLKGFC